jgi:regulator of protease activity HflC (stomatin/prohibitin superfamily)
MYGLPNIVSILIWIAAALVVTGGARHVMPMPAALVLAALLVLLGFSPRIANQWQRAIVLRLGKFTGIRGPGLFFLVPFIDWITMMIDTRVLTTSFKAEQTLTRDTVPVNVDGVLFWQVVDPERAALDVQHYAMAVGWAAQTALRDLIGRTSLADLLKGRESMELALKEMIQQRIAAWGVTVQSVEMRDVVIPEELQEAMSREAQAEREKNARVILGQAELLIAQQFADAGKIYNGNPIGLHLRAMNILYEGLKEQGAIMVVPSSAVESMSLGGITGLAALGREQMPKSA